MVGDRLGGDDDVAQQVLIGREEVAGHFRLQLVGDPRLQGTGHVPGQAVPEAVGLRLPRLHVGIFELVDDGLDDIDVVEAAGHDQAVGPFVHGEADVDQRIAFRRLSLQGDGQASLLLQSPAAPAAPPAGAPGAAPPPVPTGREDVPPVAKVDP